MFSRKDLRDLAQYRSTGPVLTLYLDTDPTNRTTDEYKLALRQLLKQVEGRAAADDIAAVERFVDFEYDWKGRGIVVFSCDADSYWQQYSLTVPVESRAMVSEKPYITPLAGLWDTYGRFVVVMVDRQGARLLLFQMGEVVNEDGVMGEEVRRQKRGRGNQNENELYRQRERSDHRPVGGRPLVLCGGAFGVVPLRFVSRHGAVGHFWSDGSTPACSIRRIIA